MTAAIDSTSCSVATYSVDMKMVVHDKQEVERRDKKEVKRKFQAQAVYIRQTRNEMLKQRVIDKKWSVKTREGYKMNIAIAKLITNVILDFQSMHEDAGQDEQDIECQHII